MSTNQLVLTSELGQSLALLSKGKVRDIYEVDLSTLLIVTTDRISAFDVILANGIPNKGAILTLLTAHWAKLLSAKIPTLSTHFSTLTLPSRIPPSLHKPYQHRSMQVRKLTPFPIEAIVRSHLTREAWDSYKLTTTVGGHPLPPGLLEGQPIPTGPLYTPSTKAPPGSPDQDISETQAAHIIGPDYASRIKHLSLKIYTTAATYALERGIIIADTKFEFGLDPATDEVVLADEILTPESSRFWPVEEYGVGRDTRGWDKQFLRDWVSAGGVAGKEDVVVPEDVVRVTEEMYKGAFGRLVGKGFEEVVGGGLIPEHGWEGARELNF
ncbi:MAG: hypothetical protein Q9182_006413 [Xanthomendoza sp. 2 TL-2023]